MFRGSGGQRRRATGAQRQRGSRFPAGTEKTRDARFAREGEREGARRRAPERGPRSYLPTALRSRPRPSSEKLGEYASTILSCGASVMGASVSGAGIFTKTTGEESAWPSTDERRSVPVTQGGRVEFVSSIDPKAPLFFIGPFREVRKVANRNFKWKINSRSSPYGFSGASRNVSSASGVRALHRM